MHRSGTSCLTGSLEAAGLYLGNIQTWNPFNLKGNRENQEIVDLHDLILADNGGSWDSPAMACQRSGIIFTSNAAREASTLCGHR